MSQDIAKAEESMPGANQQAAARRLVAQHYLGLLKEQKEMPDKIFMGGHELAHLDQNLVFLDKNKKEHPRTWAVGNKVRATAIVAALCFLAPFASTIFAPSVHLVMADLDIDDSTIGALEVSIFLFAFAVGPLFLSPLSEVYGRKIVANVGNLIFMAFSIGGGFSQTAAQLAVTRVMAGLGGSSGLAVVGGVTADLWDVKTRPKASGIVMLGPILGPIVGPVCGGWMSERASWRWTLWIPAIISGMLAIIGFVGLDETYAPRLLDRKLKNAKKGLPATTLYSVADLERKSTTAKSLVARFLRPVVYLLIDPALFTVSLFYSVLFGVMYLIIITYADVFGIGYGHSVGIVGTDFLAVGVGMIVGTISTIKAMEAIFKNGSVEGRRYSPESRLLSCLVGVPVATGGLLMYGFTATKTHFIVPLIGIVIFAAGGTNIMMGIQLYAVEGFKFPASAFASISVLRFIAGGTFPLFGAKLFESLGIDWGTGLLGFLVLGLGVLFLLLMYVFGARIRSVGESNMNSFQGLNTLSE